MINCNNCKIEIKLETEQMKEFIKSDWYKEGELLCKKCSVIQVDELLKKGEIKMKPEVMEEYLKAKKELETEEKEKNEIDEKMSELKNKLTES